MPALDILFIKQASADIFYFQQALVFIYGTYVKMSGQRPLAMQINIKLSEIIRFRDAVGGKPAQAPEFVGKIAVRQLRAKDIFLTREIDGAINRGYKLFF